MNVTLSPAPGGLSLSFPFDPGLVAALKAEVPYTARKWDNARKVWLVDAAYGQRVADLVYAMTGQRLTVPTVATSAAPEVRLLEVLYVGRCKNVNGFRIGRNDAVASGYCDGEWSVRFPESVLRAWFDFGPGDPTNGTPRQPNTLFVTLGIPQDSDEVAIKAGYRRMVKLTHPDVDREDGAAERFQAVQHAYEVLSDPLKRRKYLAGLAFEATAQAEKRASPDSFGATYTDDLYGYRSPLRCGHVLAEGVPNLGRFDVSKILQWVDITDAQGRTLITSWRAGATMFERIWT